MTAKHTEKAFEEAIVAGLLARGWAPGDPGAFDPERGLTPDDFLTFLAASEPTLWADLQKQHGPALRPALLDTLVKTLASHGTLHVLRRGFKFFGKLIPCATFKPAHGLNPDILAAYARNRLVVTRQVHFAVGREDSIDLLLSLNGLPIATAELKNPFTRQTALHAIAQYRERDPGAALFRFKERALVHFAVDPDLVYMTTRLAREGTRFLPFNRGVDRGAGNPPHPSGYRTAYMWEQVWARDSFLDIVGRFVHVMAPEPDRKGQKAQEEKVIFPRYHQLEAVRLLEEAARIEGPGHSYLVQHSAGSGKSNSIAWLAHRLSNLHSAAGEKVFDSVVVITDRRVLDKQLQDNIFQFEHKQGVVAKIDESSEQLAAALAGGTPIIITTVQKFPFVTGKIGDLPGRAYAVIIDEAHSSQGGESARQMKAVLAAKSPEDAEKTDAEEEEEDEEDRVARVARSRGRQKNLSFFAFTATPKEKTMEVFGRPNPEGKPAEFHLYSMRQAIEEEFILDVLRSYTTYKAYYRLVKATADDPRVPKKEATRQLARYMSIHPYNIAQKTAVMVEHFRASVRHKIGGRAKAMVVTGSRLHAVRYKLAFEKYLAENGHGDIGVLVAFSGEVEDPDTGIHYTEPGMNAGKDGKSLPEARLPATFEADDFHVLIVANKYQTGFDQPLLHTMYVDRRLAGVQAVQTLSRLNRTHPGKEDTFVLDFVNETEEILRSFKPYYEQTTVAETADPQKLYELSHQLESTQVFWGSEVAAFCRVFFSPRERQTAFDQAEMYRHVNPAVDRFKALDADAQEAFRGALRAFVRLYGFLTQIMPFLDTDLERLYTYGRFLETKLPQDPRKAPLQLDGDVALKYYRLDKISEGAIPLEKGENIPLRGPLDTGTRKAKEDEAKLSEIIDVVNERFGMSLGKSDELFLVGQTVEEARKDKEVIERAVANPLDNFAVFMKSRLDGLMIDRMDQNQALVTRYLNDPQFRAVLLPLLVERIYRDIRGEAAAAAGG